MGETTGQKSKRHRSEKDEEEKDVKQVSKRLKLDVPSADQIAAFLRRRGKISLTVLKIM